MKKKFGPYQNQLKTKETVKTYQESSVPSLAIIIHKIPNVSFFTHQLRLAFILLNKTVV